MLRVTSVTASSFALQSSVDASYECLLTAAALTNDRSCSNSVCSNLPFTSLSVDRCSILVTDQPIRQTVSEIYFILCCAVFVTGRIMLPLFIRLLQRAQCSHCKRCISYSNSVRPSVCPSVRLSVCPSHAGIVSKRRHVARCSLHRWACLRPDRVMEFGL